MSDKIPVTTSEDKYDHAIMAVKQEFGDNVRIEHNSEKGMTYITLTSCGRRYKVVEILMKHGLGRIGIDHHRKFVCFDRKQSPVPALWGYNCHEQVMG